MYEERQITLDAATGGMVLSRELHDGTGNRLLPAGTELSEQTIARLEARGVNHIWVEGAEPLSPEAQAERRQQWEARLKPRFGPQLDDLLMHRLYEAVLDYRTGRHP